MIHQDHRSADERGNHDDRHNQNKDAQNHQPKRPAESAPRHAIRLPEADGDAAVGLGCCEESRGQIERADEENDGIESENENEKPGREHRRRGVLRSQLRSNRYEHESD